MLHQLVSLDFIFKLLHRSILEQSFLIDDFQRDKPLVVLGVRQIHSGESSDSQLSNKFEVADVQLSVRQDPVLVLAEDDYQLDREF